jgi:hypothetical protein
VSTGSRRSPPGSDDTPPAPERIWTLGEANAILPRLSIAIGAQLVRAGEIERRFRRLQAESASAGGPVAFAELIATCPELVREVAAYEEGWEAVQNMGVVVKDARIGLCDFYGRVDGQLVWLCWRYGEPSIEFYHDLNAGFAGRKPLTGATRHRLMN